jgi:nucleoside-diphosphate-sugar epimerase
MRVFVTGATGYVGFGAATALSRAGHEVWGLARDEDKARLLARNEIRPVLGSLQDPSSFCDAVERSSVLVHAAADYDTDTFALDRKTVEMLLEWGQRGAQPKTIVYTSGVWVHGSTGDRLVDETTPLAPIRRVTRRLESERLVLDAGGVRGIVVRPGCLYGRQGGLTGSWFHAAVNEKALRVVGDGSNRWAMVHVDDVADAYVRIAESGLTSEIFDITDRSRATVGEMVRAVARVTEYGGEVQFIPPAEAAKTMGDYAEALALDQHIDARKAVRMLGWQPKHGGFLDGVETYFDSWKAAQQR